MGVVESDLGYTPVCNNCGVHLCWDISDFDYDEAEAFWDAWMCEKCNGSRMSRKEWIIKNKESSND